MAFTEVYDPNTPRTLGHIRDLTLQGVLLVGEQQLAVNTQIVLEFELPGGLPGISATQLTLPARVVRCEADENSQTFQIGFSFTRAKPEDSEILQALLERYHFRP